MFALDPLHPVFNATIEIVADAPGISVSDLHKRLRQLRHDVTLQHLYRILNRLIEAQILLKEKGKLSLNRLWLGQISMLATNAAQNLEKAEEGKPQLPTKDGESITLTAPTLTGMQALWYHTLAHLHGHIGAQVKEVDKYYTHAWWLVEESDELFLFLRRIAKRGITCHWLLGADTYLDRRAVQEYKDIFPIRVADKDLFPADGYNLNIYGDYVLECIFPPAISKHFQLLFSSVASKKDFDPALFRHVFELKERYTIKVWKNASLATQLRAKIRQFFR